MVEISENYVEINGFKLYYEELGKGPPLVLIHGGISTSRSGWEPCYRFFAEQFRVIALDSRGHGRSENPSMEISYRLMADDTVAFIEELGLENPLVCGWSDGGQVALEIGIEYPESARALVAGGVLSEMSDHYVQGMKAWGLNGPGDIDVQKLQEIVPEFAASLKEIHSHVYGKDYWKELLTISSNMWFDPDSFPKERIRKISTPTLIAQGDRDEAVPLEDAVKIFKMLPKGELAIIAGAGHDGILTQAPKFAGAIIEFLNRQ
ncbi:MAG: alpha/beta fold hydrolase [Candidatus Thorarchaeota archaeon]